MAIDKGELISNIAETAAGVATTAAEAYSTYGEVKEAKDIASQIQAMQLSPSAGGGSFDSWTNTFINTGKVRPIHLSDL